MISFEKFGFVVDCFLCELFLYKMKFLRFLLKFKRLFNLTLITSMIDKVTTKESRRMNAYCIQYKLSRWASVLWALSVSLLQPRTLSLWRPASSA